MSKSDVALQLTLKAIECGGIKLDGTNTTSLRDVTNKTNAKIIVDFYNSVTDEINNLQNKSNN